MNFYNRKNTLQCTFHNRLDVNFRISTVDLFDKAQWSGFLIFHLQRFRAEILFLKNTVVSIPQSTTSSCCFRYGSNGNVWLWYDTILSNHYRDVRITGELRNCHEDAHLRILSGEDFRDVRRIQLENALLVQELQFEREEKADVKAQIYLIARDNVDLKLTLEMEQSKSRSYKVQLEHLKQELSRLSVRLN